MNDPIERQAAIGRAVEIPLFGKLVKVVAVSELEALPSAQPDVPDTNDGDMISRQAAINEITEYGDGRTLYMSVGDLKYRLEHLPSARPEIIRCKDCKHIGDAYTKRQGETWCFCSEIGTGTELNGWCWHGERREEDDRPD